MKPADSFVTNCLLIHKQPRDDQAPPMFYYSDETGVLAALDGYAIIPVEMYEAMLAKFDPSAFVKAA